MVILLTHAVRRYNGLESQVVVCIHVYVYVYGLNYVFRLGCVYGYVVGDVLDGHVTWLMYLHVCVFVSGCMFTL